MPAATSQDSWGTARPAARGSRRRNRPPGPRCPSAAAGSMTPQVHDALRRRVYDPLRRQIHPTPPEGCQEDLRCSLRPAGADPCSLWLCRDGSSMSTRAQHQWSDAFLKSPLWQLKAFTPSRRRSVFLQVAEENSMKQGMQKQLRH